MDVSPRELRDTDIREAFRGYNRDDVDELLERAAATIEGLSERVRQITERIAEAESSATRNREAEETLQRTLVLAQKTADEAVADAQKRSRKLMEDAENKARTMVTEAETTARRIAEEEKRRLEAQVLELAAKREKLTTDVDALERFESEYKQRIRGAIEAELDSLGQSIPPGPPRPPVQEVVLPTPREGVVEREPAVQRERVGGPAGPEAAGPEPGPVASAPEGPPPPEAAAEGPLPARGDQAGGGSPEWGGSAATREAAPAPEAASPAPADGLAAYMADEPIEAEVLDDDAFFASLREAVRDEAPLGPRDDATPDAFFDQEEADGRRRFRRRR